jgi:hypothetical protein
MFLRPMLHHHGNTGSGWAHNFLIITENIYEMFRHPPGIVPVTRIEERLAAAGLVLVVYRLFSETSQKPVSGNADFRHHEVYGARDEKGHHNTTHL